MRFLLVALVALLTLSSAFAWDPGPAPGLKLKNAILYMLALGLMLRASMDKDFRLQLPAIPAAFALWIVYAIVSFVAIVMVIQYQHYDPLKNALDLKGLVDQMLFFLVFFYGLRSEQDTVRMLKFLLIAFALSHFMALLDAFNVVSFGAIERREDGRVQGAIGESNQYGAFVAMTLPAVLAMAFMTRGVQRLGWFLATAVTAITLLLTVSRGAFVATIVAGGCAVLLFRRYAPPGRLTMLSIGAVACVVLIVVTISTLGYGELLYQRLIGQSEGDMGSASSGRTEIWSDAIATMFEQPVTLLTGFGWQAYWSMPFRFSPHNHYLNQWFNLGLVGLCCSIFLLAYPIRTALRVINTAPAGKRPALMGFVIGAIAIAVATFFVDLYMPWLYFWAYAGVAMRLAVLQSEHVSDVAVAAPQRQEAARAADPFGWRGRISTSRVSGG